MIDIKRIIIALLALAVIACAAYAETANPYDLQAMAEFHAEDVAELVVVSYADGAVGINALLEGGGEAACMLPAETAHGSILVAGIPETARVRVGGIGDAGSYAGPDVYIEGNIAALTVRTDADCSAHIAGIVGACNFVGGNIVLHENARIAALYLLGPEAKRMRAADGSALAGDCRAEFEALEQVSIAIFDPVFLPE